MDAVLIRTILLLALAAVGTAPAARAAPADDYFEVGVEYLRKGFYSAARAALAESLVRAPRQPVPLAFLALAGAAEGRPAKETAELLRAAHRHLPGKRGFRFDLRKLLPSAKALTLLAADYRRGLRKAKGTLRLNRLAILGFLQRHDGTPDAPAWRELRKLSPKDPVLRGWTPPKPKRPAPKTTS